MSRLCQLVHGGGKVSGVGRTLREGYLNAQSPDGGSGATHAWTEVYLPGAGWKGFDPTLGELVGSRHIAVAVARATGRGITRDR